MWKKELESSLHKELSKFHKKANKPIKKVGKMWTDLRLSSTWKEAHDH